MNQHEPVGKHNIARCFKGLKWIFKPFHYPWNSRSWGYIQCECEVKSDTPQCTALSSHLIPIIDARSLLGVVSLPPSATHQPSPHHSVNVYNIGRSDVTTDKMGRPVRHQRVWSQQIQARRAPSTWRQLVTSRNRVASPSRVHNHFLYPLQNCTTRLRNINHRHAHLICRVCHRHRQNEAHLFWHGFVPLQNSRVF
jgi:hypothetical protein